MLFVFLLSSVVRLALFEQLNVYYMNNDQPVGSSQQSMYDCLHYYVEDGNLLYQIQYDIAKYDLTISKTTHQIILYCFRPLKKSKYDLLIFSDSTFNNYFKFDELRALNYTSEQLYSWSAPIDLVEQYQLYLNGNDSLFETRFYNCTQGWFGPLCQYSFNFVNKSLSFGDIVKTTFALKRKYYDQNLETSLIFSNLSCYTYLQCNRGGSFPACLDWREICNGKVDCIDGGFDEQNCDELEINECEENEYRCHNGQCIPEYFLWDDSINPECLDGTDEIQRFSYNPSCPYDPSFRCEDVMCRPKDEMKSVVCGDGACSLNIEMCVNKRDVLLNKGMIESTTSVSAICRDAMACVTGLDECETRVKITHHCPDLFQFPGVPVLFGHVALVYSNKLSDMAHQSNILLPKYVCFDALLCSLPSVAQVSNYSACWPIEELATFFTTEHYSDSWVLLINELRYIFSTCAMVSGGYCRHNQTLYACNSTPKCISKHRLLDGIEDCLLKDDETFVQSCSLKHSKHRISCDKQCLSPIMIGNYKPDCSQNEDEQSPYNMRLQNDIFFQTICDGYDELIPLFINEHNYTDETECDLWPCNNSYTRCNGIWNCPKGDDEMNCPPSTCPPLRTILFVRLAPNKLGTSRQIEKPLSTSMNCSDALDERQLCQKWDHFFKSSPFWFTSDGEEVQTADLCIDRPKCIYHDNEQFCGPSSRLCYLDSGPVQGETYRLQCEFVTSDKQKFIPFSLNYPRVYPLNFQSSKSKLDLVSIEYTPVAQENIRLKYNILDLTRTWRCNRGLNVRVQLGDKKYEEKCLCPPSYFGDLCQYQNQRVSLTMHVRASSDWRTVFAIILTLIDDHDDEQLINSYDEIEYLPIRDCNTKFNIYLLYLVEPKNISKNYSVRIDAFNKHSLMYIASWVFRIPFSFLPISRMALQIIIPTQLMESCSLDCGMHGQCLKYQNSKAYFCRCNSGWSGSKCNKRHTCDCANDSLCIGPSICLCRPEKFGPRCYLRRNPCELDSCMNDGVCVLADQRISQNKFTCICPEGFFGSRCQLKQIKINIKFQGVTIPPFTLVHFIEISEQNKPPIRATTFKKIAIYQDSIIIYRTFSFHIVLVQFSKSFYLPVLQEKRVSSGVISTDISPSNRCSSVDELFNTTFAELHLIRRIKYYHIPCQKHSDLSCFYDDTQICFCNLLKEANCFEFNHSLNYNCRDGNYCENDGRCFLDDLKCPTASACSCLDCYYGSRCQLSTKGMSLSLDIILGYHILPNIGFMQQPLVVSISAAITIIGVLIGLLNSFLSIVTFQSKKTRDTGCSIYILTSSIISSLTMIMFGLKFWFLVISQMALIVNRSFLDFHCRSTDYLLRIFLIIGDWLNACVAIERTISVAKGLNFNMSKSVRAAKWVILSIVLLTMSTSIQDPIYRHLIDDEEEQRTWCVMKYSSSVQTFNSIMILFHFLTPFIINLISAFLIIILAARRRSVGHKQLPYIQYFRQQFQEHKHLLISASALVILALPPLAFSFLLDCMKSVRDPSLFLVGYFVSFLPPTLTFIVFVLPSSTYKDQFKKGIKCIRRKFHCG